MKMNFALLLTSLVLVFAGTATGNQRGVSVDGTLDAFYQYIWRGYNMGDRLALQPGVSLGFGQTGVSLGVWGSAAMQDRGAPKNLDQFDELDFTLAVARPLNEARGLWISAGYTQYTFPSLGAGPRHTEEVFGSLEWDNFLAPSLTAYYDFGTFDAWYVVAGVALEIPLTSEGTVALDLGTSLAFGNATRSFGFQNATLTAGIRISRGGITWGPVIGFSYADRSVNPDKSEVWGGLSLSFTR